KATFMACSSFGRELVRQPPVGTLRRAASALGPVPDDGGRPEPAATAPGPTATAGRSDRGRAVPPEPSPEPAATAATGWSGRGRCRTTSLAGRPRRRGT